MARLLPPRLRSRQRCAPLLRLHKWWRQQYVFDGIKLGLKASTSTSIMVAPRPAEVDDVPRRVVVKGTLYNPTSGCHLFTKLTVAGEFRISSGLRHFLAILALCVLQHRLER